LGCSPTCLPTKDLMVWTIGHSVARSVIRCISIFFVVVNKYGLQLYLQYADCMSKLPDLLLDVALGEEDPIQARELERLSRAVPQLLGLLPEMFPDKTNIRQQICLGNMISSLMQFLPALKHRGMVSFSHISFSLVPILTSRPDDSPSTSVSHGGRVGAVGAYPSYGPRPVHDCHRKLCLKFPVTRSVPLMCLMSVAFIIILLL
jgi:hypothetical protein